MLISVVVLIFPTYIADGHNRVTLELKIVQGLHQKIRNGGRGMTRSLVIRLRVYVTH